ncbi:exocyst complex component 5 [Aphanothece sacrum FPU1]|uniref:Exocyst complex component 5 n=1 Tax=Aphanothece sacrum FPU1 TaxID=1920663 RepID=A0A401INR7_APHSA|nr:exocyst complex component 5 [Aphanothece sacrum FPU1]GBF86936.1 exocyst complex component 5 [Aphanothece sacrum FPU3]
MEILLFVDKRKDSHCEAYITKKYTLYTTALSTRILSFTIAKNFQVFLSFLYSMIHLSEA